MTVKIDRMHAWLLIFFPCRIGRDADRHVVPPTCCDDDTWLAAPACLIIAVSVNLEAVR